jgi:hypothetical protein
MSLISKEAKNIHGLSHHYPTWKKDRADWQAQPKSSCFARGPPSTKWEIGLPQDTHIKKSKLSILY